MNIILGSQSPRRRELLAGLDLSFDSVNIQADESYPSSLQAGDIPIYIARAKALAYRDKLKEDDLLITADTIVWCDGQMMGKPVNDAEAKLMLRHLSGKTHQVYTAVCFARKDYFDEFVDKTDVSFRLLTDDEIDYYVTTYKPFDKAGAYGIQEWIGFIGVTAINGSYFNVMGLPVEKVYDYLSRYPGIPASR